MTTALAIAGRARRALALVVVVRAALWGAAAALALLVLFAAADLAVAVPLALRRVAVPGAVLAALAAAALSLWRGRRARSLPHVALWLEEHAPQLRFALVTGVEREAAGLPGVAVPAFDAAAPLRSRGARAVAGPAVAAAVAALVLAALPRGEVRRVAAPAVGDALERSAPSRAASRLAPLVATVTPPAYSGLPRAVIDEPVTVRALVGSVVALEGRGRAAGISAQAGTARLAAAASGAERWRIALRVDTAPVALRLRDGVGERIVALEPIADAAPRVLLVSPAHDSVMAVARGRLLLAAEASDDYGLSDARFELIVSSGEGETYTFRSTAIGARRLGGKRARVEASLPLDSLALAPGSVVHLRAVAHDANDVTGPGLGSSETRVLRVPRTDEGDSVAVEPAPPPELKNAISQRMLIQLAEELERRRPRLARETVVTESRRIGVDQRRLRRSVAAIVFARAGGEDAGEETEGDTSSTDALTPEELLQRAEEATAKDPTQAIDFAGGESPVVAINRPLLEAYNAMWDAGRALDMGEPGAALPHMRRALAAIERARAAERVYLRGRTPAVVVDVSAARLKGKESGVPGARTPRPVADPRRAAMERRFSSIVELAARGAPATADSLVLLRIDALADAPRFAAALGDASEALRRGDAAAASRALARARRELAGAPRSTDSLTPWGTLP